jgi:5S rRNA maturation endonuclease (ribonuclease M5)
MIVDVPRLLEALGIKAREHGGELWAACPHPQHSETRPSWSIKDDPHDPANGTHYCFGCQFTGTPVDLVAAVIGIPPGAAYRWIKDRGFVLQGVLPLEVALSVRTRTTALRIPRGLIAKPFERWATPVRVYAQRRGLTPEQVKRWELCYAIDGDMAGRIVFPCQDVDGTWLSWHARTYCAQDKRYKNASAADGFDAGAVFGLRWWPDSEVRSESTLVLTEGALDALACEREGAAYIAAIGGSEPHARQLLKLASWGRILVATDGDKAGDNLYLTLRQAIGAKVDCRRVDIPRTTETEKWDAAKLAVKQPGKLRTLLLLAENGESAEPRNGEAPSASAAQSPGKNSARRVLRRLRVPGNGS